jgi:DNA-directed RNA polymerase II subunit RPB9
MAANAPNVRRTIFCDTCDNVLYPVQRDKALFWHCRLCDSQIQMPAEDIYYVHQADIKRSEEADSKALESLKDFVNDRTVMRATDKKCPKCSCKDAAWFINPLTKTDHDMTIYFACVECQHVWTDPKKAQKE